MNAKTENAREVINIEVRESIRIKAHTSLFQALVRNLLENALKYSPPGETIDVTLADGKLRISDRGPGIPEKELENVFHRFYRVDGDASSGSGLGLSICKEIANLYGFSIRLENRIEVASGVTASIVFSEPDASS